MFLVRSVRIRSERSLWARQKPLTLFAESFCTNDTVRQPTSETLRNVQPHGRRYRLVQPKNPLANSPFSTRTHAARCKRIGARMQLLMLPQSCFRQINVPLDVAQDFVVDDAIVAELKNSPAFHPERFLR